jgi:hypothetical protein
MPIFIYPVSMLPMLERFVNEEKGEEWERVWIPPPKSE